MNNIREAAVRYAMSVILNSADWQEVMDALSNHDRFSPWLDSFSGDDEDTTEYMSIIREAERRMLANGSMPDTYSD